MSCRAWRAIPQQARPPGATALPPPASSSRCCRRCSARWPTRPGRAKPWIAFFAAIKIVSLSLLWFAAPGSKPAPCRAVLLAGLGGRRILDRVQRFDDAAPGVQGRDRPHLQHRLGARLSRRHDRADLRRHLHGGLARDRQDDDRHRPAVRARPGDSARMRAPPGRWRRCGTSSSSCRCSCSRPTPARACRSARRCARGWPSFEVDTRRGAPARPASSASCLPAWSTRTASTRCWRSAACSLPRMFGWSITEIGMFGIILNVVAIVGCLGGEPAGQPLRLQGGRADWRWSCSPSPRSASSRPDRATRCSACCGSPAAIRRRAVRHGGGKGLYPVRAADRPGIRPGAGLVALLSGAQRLGGRGRPLFRHLCAGRPGDQLRRAVPGGHRHRR